MAPGEVRPDAPALEARVRAPGEVLPVKGFLPVFVPRPGGRRGLLPPAAARAGDGGGGGRGRRRFRSILSREEAERFAGHLLRLKLEGRLELEVEAG